jgi:protein-tyrosine-phosphatase
LIYVCLGNQLRSVVAERYTRLLLEESSLDHAVASAGAGVDPRSEHYIGRLVPDHYCTSREYQLRVLRRRRMVGEAEGRELSDTEIERRYEEMLLLGLEMAFPPESYRVGGREVSLEGHQLRQITRAMLAGHDLAIGMDEGIERYLGLLGAGEVRVMGILSFLADGGEGIPDPSARRPRLEFLLGEIEKGVEGVIGELLSAEPGGR